MPYDTNTLVASAVADGAISAYRLVRFANGDSAEADDEVSQATANSHVAGAGPQYATADTISLPYIFGGVAQVTLGGTVTRGDRVKSDATGRAVALENGGLANQNVAGVARRSGVVGDVVPIQIELYQVAPGDYIS